MITGLNRVPIRSAGEFRRRLTTLSTDDPTAVTLIRGGASVELEVMAERAVPLYTRLCEVNELGACATIGYMLAIGARVPRDPALAEDLLRTACDDGELTACLNIGYLLETGKLGSAEPGLAAAPY